MKKSQVQFNTNALKKAMMENLVEEQTRRLVAYAKDIVKQIGEAINSYHSAKHMDRYGNLLDSLCWGVSYKGKMQDCGFFREKTASQESYLHEWTRRYKFGGAKGETHEQYPVNGHELAEEYIRKYGSPYTEGWRVFFAVLAPYWGYWEDGFNMRVGGKSLGFRKFSVMTWFYDTISKDLKPNGKSFKVGVPTYSHSYKLGKTYVRGSLERDYDSYAKYSGNKRRRKKW